MDFCQAATSPPKPLRSRIERGTSTSSTGSVRPARDDSGVEAVGPLGHRLGESFGVETDRRRGDAAGDTLFHPLRPDLPFHEQAVRGDAGLEGQRIRRPVKVVEVGSADGPQGVKVEVGVAGLQGIVRPGDQVVVAGQGFFALGPLEGLAQPQPLVLGQDRQMVGVLNGSAAVDGRVGVDIARRDSVDEGPQEDRAHVHRNPELVGRRDLQVGAVPDAPLDADAGFVVGRRVQRTDSD
jgi:hypothetical protein